MGSPQEQQTAPASLHPAGAGFCRSAPGGGVRGERCKIFSARSWSLAERAWLLIACRLIFIVASVVGAGRIRRLRPIYNARCALSTNIVNNRMMKPRKPELLAVRLTRAQMTALKRLSRKYNMTTAEMVRALISQAGAANAQR